MAKNILQRSAIARGLAVKWSKAEIAAEPLPPAAADATRKKNREDTLSTLQRVFPLGAVCRWWMVPPLQPAQPPDLSELTSTPHNRGDCPCPQVGTVWKGASPHPKRQHPKQQTWQPQLWQHPNGKELSNIAQEGLCLTNISWADCNLPGSGCRMQATCGEDFKVLEIHPPCFPSWAQLVAILTFVEPKASSASGSLEDPGLWLCEKYLATELTDHRVKKEVLKIKARLLWHFRAWLLTSSASHTLDLLAYFYQMKLMVAATVTLCGYRAGSQQVLGACFLCGFPPCSVLPPKSLSTVYLTLLGLTCNCCLLWRPVDLSVLSHHSRFC